MKFLTNLSQTTQGIMLIIGGLLMLINTLGIGGETINTIIMLAALGIIGIGVYLSDIHRKIYRILAKERSEKTPPE